MRIARGTSDQTSAADRLLKSRRKKKTFSIKLIFATVHYFLFAVFQKAGKTTSNNPADDKFYNQILRPTISIHTVIVSKHKLRKALYTSRVIVRNDIPSPVSPL